ncbi:hypothetical protein RJ641_032819 [Dillenia turbinata]|uniref:Uncharacterized protein n=1 Tax=Dillenia turbinata TaxID=194707 RepID=A0AAN8ZCS8_9MAGN
MNADEFQRERERDGKETRQAPKIGTSTISFSRPHNSNASVGCHASLQRFFHHNSSYPIQCS